MYWVYGVCGAWVVWDWTTLTISDDEMNGVVDLDNRERGVHWTVAFLLAFQILVSVRVNGLLLLSGSVWFVRDNS